MTDETQTEIILRQLAEGNAGAQAYFMKRVDLFINDMQPSDCSAPLQPHLALAGFMQAAWPAFAKGVRQRTKDRLAAQGEKITA